MATIINRFYAAEDQAAGAADAAKRKFSENDVNLVAPTDDPAGIEAAIVKGGVSKSEAAAYAKKVREGLWLLSVQASWGFANEAVRVLDKYESVDAGLGPEEEPARSGSDEAAPFSAWLGWPVLKPFSSNVQLVAFKSSVKLLSDAAPFSALFKWPVLTPFKTSVVLLDDPAPLSAKLGLWVLRDSKPFSSLVTNDKSNAKLVNLAAPFSEFFNLPVLWKDFGARRRA